MDIRTDLAVEARGMHSDVTEGIENEVFFKNGIKTERIRIVSEEAGKVIGKPCGTYTTLTFGDLSENDREDYENACMCVAEELKGVLEIGERGSVLVIGLGNDEITADSIGPKCVKNLLVTRHIKEMMPEEIDESVRSVSALVPGVMAYTGIETQEIVRGVAERVMPDLIIAVDALASRSMSRLGRTIQIADTGINPGSGVGNNRKELSKASLGIRVIAIGVPMVVDAKTVMLDSLQTAGTSEEETERIFNMYKEKEPDSISMVVTPKDADALSERSARIIANGINIALQSALGKEDIDRYTSV